MWYIRCVWEEVFSVCVCVCSVYGAGCLVFACVWGGVFGVCVYVRLYVFRYV